uniref:Membrane associated GTPase n=1 Tax=Paulinella chromatophora TaxID=39717 RepID=B1X5R8_PAUCH|nr:hypothetical protein PCC_0878 [Paulinella chromatophora]ACB43287.1 hypothetical protein PCC_0878 [Paulinella chromatophora]
MFQQTALTYSVKTNLSETPGVSANTASLIPWRSVIVSCGFMLTAECLFRDVLHLPIDRLGIVAVIGSWWWLTKPVRPLGKKIPLTIEGLREGCQRLLNQFERLEGSKNIQKSTREKELESLCARHGREVQEIALVGTYLPELKISQELALSISGSTAIVFHQANPLSLNGGKWELPQSLMRCDHLIYFLEIPMKAADLRWLENIPSDQSVWILVHDPDTSNIKQREERSIQFRDQLPLRFEKNQYRFWNGNSSDLKATFEEFLFQLHNQGPTRIIQTEKRLIQSLHSKWNQELEQIRRLYFNQLQNRTQWIVAAAVFASPFASTDLLVVSVANSLMVQEMARLWDCPWELDQLRAAATELSKAALRLGVIEWSTNNLLSLAKLEGTTWLATSSLQALSAAYLTRVVSRSMADLLGSQAHEINIGMNPEAFKQEALVLVARAAESEKLDWLGFLKESKRWLQSSMNRGLQPSFTLF